MFKALADRLEARMEQLSNKQLTKYAYACGLVEFWDFISFKKLVQVRMACHHWD